jgi:hypothetical protein
MGSGEVVRGNEVGGGSGRLMGAVMDGMEMLIVKIYLIKTVH